MRSLIAGALLSCALGCGLGPESICDNTNNPCRAGFACVLGVCQPAAAPTCTDGVRNGTEADVDCGGTCAPCGASLRCASGGDCASSLCVNNLCACPAGQHVEGTSCVNNSDTACGPSKTNCGAAFPGGTAVCDAPAGTCLLTSCNTGTHLCNGACAPNDSPQSCGSSCTPCPAPVNGSAVCNAGSCGIQCSPGYHVNGAACDLDTNTACGSPTNDCTTTAFPNGTGHCVISTTTAPSSCVLDSCNTGFHASGGSCVSNSVTSCGGVNCTDAAHQDPNGTMTCNGTQCAVANCNPGYHPSANSAACVASTNTCCGPNPGCADCTSTTTFPNGSGVCTVSAGTSGGACTVATCNTGFHVDTASNSCVANSNTACGSPTNDCTKILNATATCNTTAGTCTITCNTGYHLFNGACEANTDTVCGSNRTNCTTLYPNGTGSCDAASGTCFLAGCLAGYHNCGGSCVSNTSTNSCSASCTPCPTDPNGAPTCNGTSCGISCNIGYNNCGGGACKADTNSVCGSACDNCAVQTGFACRSGSCVCIDTAKCTL